MGDWQPILIVCPACTPKIFAAWPPDIETVDFYQVCLLCTGFTYRRDVFAHRGRGRWQPYFAIWSGSCHHCKTFFWFRPPGYIRNS